MGKGLSIAGFISSVVSLVLGILGIVIWVFPFIALPVAIAGLVLSIIGGKKMRAAEQSSGLATAGMVIGIIAVAINGILFFTCGVCALAAASNPYYY